jgi:hypothetical protein
MSIQTIINKSTAMQVNRRKMVGIQYTRNEIPRISETPTTNPWRFNMTMPNSLRYNDARTIIETLDTLDRKAPETISFGNLPNMSWIFNYQGQASVSQLANMRVTSFVGNQLVLNTLPPIGSTRVLFAPNDLIQIGNYPYPFTSTTEILRGDANEVTITTHRPNILSNSVVGLGITVGSSCQFRVFCPNMPVYKLFPGGAMYNSDGSLQNNAYIEWSDEFQLYEYVGLA